MTYLGADNAGGMRLAVQHLQRLGHKKIGYLSSALGAYVYQQRYKSFFLAMEECGLPCEEGQARDSYHTSVCMEEHLPALLKMGCTGIVCSHDVLAQSTLKHCAEMGIRVPEDVSIIGFDDLPLCQHTQPPMTTIRQNRTELGRSAYCALSSQMEGVPLSTFLLHTELVRRDSCAPLPAEV